MSNTDTPMSITNAKAAARHMTEILRAFCDTTTHIGAEFDTLTPVEIGRRVRNIAVAEFGHATADARLIGNAAHLAAVKARG